MQIDLNALIQEQLSGTPYEGTDHSLYYVFSKGDKNGTEEENRQYIANGVPILACHRKRDDGVTVQSILVVVPIVNGKRLSACEIPVSDIDNKLMSHMPVEFRPAIKGNPRAYIVDCIRAQAVNLPEDIVYEHTGIRKIDGKYVFLHANGAVTETGIKTNIKTDLEGRNGQYSLIAPTTGTRWDTFRKYLEIAPYRITYPLMAFAALCPLNEALRKHGFEPSFMLFLLGKTGSMKSTLAALTLCFFGDFTEKTLPSGSNDTVNSLEKNGFLLKDVLTVIDDFYPTSNRIAQTKMEDTLQGVLRIYGNRTGKGRLNADSKKRPLYPAKGNALLTGEDVPAVGQSGEARFIGIELNPGDVSIETLSHVQEHKTELTECMTEYIQWLLPLYDTITDQIGQRFLELRTEALNEGHKRVTEAIAHLQLSLEIFTEFLKDKGVLSEDEAEQMLTESLQIFSKLAVQQNKRLTEEKPTTLFITALNDLLSVNAVSIAGINCELQPNGIGWKDNRYIYLKSGLTYAAIKEYYRKQDRTFPLSEKQLLKHLALEKMIETGADNTKTLRLGKPKKKERVVFMYADCLNADEDGQEGGE